MVSRDEEEVLRVLARAKTPKRMTEKAADKFAADLALSAVKGKPTERAVRSLLARHPRYVKALTAAPSATPERQATTKPHSKGNLEPIESRDIQADDRGRA
ncbi:hypothetical protein ACFWIB_42150 [Streptomyces sp. NPDC127051]|uniref:hypothetical protein n=1 Tax=Streptomyces sp. NPDC127051 TaxID=3347119 RepID=UPI0036581884